MKNNTKKEFFVRSEWAVEKVKKYFGVNVTPVEVMFPNPYNVGCTCCPRVFYKEGWKFTLENISSRELKRKYGIISNNIT